jgi:ubiquitin carboxyl-terminal hydrolase 34
MTACNNGQDDDMSRFPFGENFGDDTAVDEAFSAFLSAYVQLCSQLFLVDVHFLNQPRSDELLSSPLLSERHLHQLPAIFRTEKVPLFNLLRRQYGVNVRDLQNRLNMGFLAANGAQNLLRFADECFRSVPTFSQNYIALNICQVLSILGWTVCRLPSARAGIEPVDYFRGALLFFRKYAEDMREPARIADAAVAKDLIACFSTFVQELSQWDDRSASILAEELLSIQAPNSPSTSSPVDAPDASTSADATDYRQYTDFLPVLISNSWKFNMLRKYIVKGRMELRVMSITYMDEQLVSLYQHYTSSDTTDKYLPDKHPVLRHLADVLLRSKVVDYIISVDSHPQLISRSGNIAGFLVVTERWADSQADAIWNTVANSPDPRVITATITMLLNILNLMQPTDLLYLCEKLQDLPIESFTPDILKFLEEVTKKLLAQPVTDDWSSRGVTARPWNVCVRLLQDTAPKNDATKHHLDIHVGATKQLHSLTPSIPEADRQSILLRCMEHIIARSEAATGSVKVICMLSTSADTPFFEQNEELVRQVLEEVPLFVEAEAKSGPHRHQLSALQYRLELLGFLACRAGQLIPENLYKDLSNHIVGPQALSNHARDAAWAQLLLAARLSVNNDFCRQLILSYVPEMEPQYFTPGLYEFVANYNFPLTRKTFQIEDGQQALLQIPGGDILWSLALTSPPGTIEEYAARELAVRYVQIAQRRDVTLPEVEFAHWELVERCMKELRSASSTMHETSDGHEQNSKLRFCRILLFQKQMLELVRQRPEFNRGRRADSKVESMDIEAASANAITIKYQFGSDRKTIAISPDRTMADLYRLLCRATDCVKVNIYTGGQKLDVAQQSDRSVADVKISDQLLVQAVQRDETARAVSAPVAGFSEFETTLVKHFDEMYGWMDADDATSQLLFEFLTQFPYRSTITNSVAAGEATLESLFPPGKFFQAKYAVQAIHSKLKDQLRNSNLDEAFLVNAIKLLDRAVLSEELFGSDAVIADRLSLASVFISAMLDFLRERPSSDLSKDYFSNEAALADRLMRILIISIEVDDAVKVAQECYATILEASLCCPTVWKTFWEHPEVAQVHRTLLLTDHRENLRKHIELKILSICGGHLPSSRSLDAADISSRYWTTIASILPGASQFSEQSVQLFELAQHVFRVYDEYHRSEDNLRILLQSWCSLLLAHDHSEVPGRYEVDHVVMGFTKLLLCLVPSLKSYKHPLNAGRLISSIFQKFLFNGYVFTTSNRCSELFTFALIEPVANTAQCKANRNCRASR